MSRAFKQRLADECTDLGATGVSGSALEGLSGADLEQVRLTVLNGDSAAVSEVSTTGNQPTVESKKTLGGNAAFGGTPNSAALSGADLERFAGDQ